MDSKEIGARQLTFDETLHEEDGVEFWLAREIMAPLGYSRWENFETAISRAMQSLDSSKTAVENHFRDVTKMVKVGSGATRTVKDYKLTRYACYLIAMNGDPRKPEIAFAQSYFALQTRNHELIGKRMEEIQRLQSRGTLAETEKMFAAIAFERDVDAQGLARIKSFGDRALFGGHDTSDMKRLLGVPDRKPLADVLPDVTLAAKNLAMSMTSHNTVEKDLRGEELISGEHVENNAGVRETLVSRAIYPEQLPAEEDTKRVERRVRSDERRLLQQAKSFDGS